jgi:outer membrane protein TolC
MLKQKQIRLKTKLPKNIKMQLLKQNLQLKAALAARDAAEKAKNASEEARKAYEKAEKELARLEQELKNLLGEIGIDLGPGEEGAWDPREKIAQNKDRKMEMSEIKSNQNLSECYEFYE